MNIHNRQEYETDVLRTFRSLASKPLPGMSDDDCDDEYRALDQFYAALARFRSQTQDCAALSELRRKQLLTLLETVNEGRPDRGAWEEAINAKRRGWE